MPKAKPKEPEAQTVAAAEAVTETVQRFPLSELHPFEGHPFKVLDDEAMTETVESIRMVGITNPLIVRPDPDGGYEIISGHRRHHAAELAGLDAIPVIVRELDDDAAVIMMVDSNLQRENILPSERAKAYKMKMDALRHQGHRTDLTSPQVAAKFQPVKELKMSGSEARAKWVKSGETERALRETQTSPSPKGQLFKIHSSEFKPHPARNPGQTSMVCIAQAMPFLCVSKDSFNGLFPQGVELLAQLRFPKLLHEIKGSLPDMCGKDTLAFLVGAAGLPAGAIFAELRRAAIGTFPIFAGPCLSFLCIGCREGWGFGCLLRSYGRSTGFYIQRPSR